MREKICAEKILLQKFSLLFLSAVDTVKFGSLSKLQRNLKL